MSEASVFVDAPCKGQDIFDKKKMLPLCEGCHLVTACRQSAADAPFIAEGVWGGLVLPRQRKLLPPPTEQAAYAEPYSNPITASNPKGAGRRPWWADLGRNREPGAGKHSRPLIPD